MLSSLKLSKELEKRGFDKEMDSAVKEELRSKCVWYKSYDILYSLCIKHGKELFGDGLGRTLTTEITIYLMMLDGQNQDTIEDYIIKNLVI